MVAYRLGKCLLPDHLSNKRMSQTELAERVGKTKQTIHRYCNNSQVMSFESAYNISKVLGCTMEDLYEILE